MRMLGDYAAPRPTSTPSWEHSAAMPTCMDCCDCDPCLIPGYEGVGYCLLNNCFVTADDAEDDCFKRR